MDEKLKTLYELCETIMRELKDACEKIRSAGSKLSVGDVDYIDKLTHSLKSVKTTIAMIESEDSGYSNYGNSRRSYNSYNSYRNSYDDGSYADGNSYRRSMRRDGMGRYSGHGDIESLLDDMREQMDTLPEDKRREVQKFIDKMDRM